MPAVSDYVTGSISLTNGSINFTGTSTGWLLAGFKEGDTIIDITGATEFMGVIATIDANGAGTLTKAWEGPTLVDVAYRMRYQPDGARVSAQARNLIELLGNGNVLALAGLSGSANQVPMFTGPGAMTLVPKTDLVSGVAYDVQVDLLADRDAYDGQAEGFSVLVADVGDGRAAVYAKASAASGDWTDPAYVTGPVGPAPVFTVDTTTTLAPGSAATFVLTPTVDGYEIDIGIPAGRADGVPFLWDTGTADADPGSGDLRANNASLGSATFLYVSKTSAAGSAVAAYLLSLDDSTNPTKKGDLILKRSADGVIASFIVGTVTDATNYVTIAVSGHSGATSFTAADLIQFEFARAGDKGADGAGTGDVVGPASSTNNAIVRFDGTTGKLLKELGSGVANSDMALMAEATVKGRAVGSGTNVPSDLTGAQVAAIVMAGGQLAFPATQIPSANANTLDDYEEGTYTPTYTNITIGNGTVSSKYTKVGDLIHLEWSLTWGSTTSATASPTTIGLPFTAGADGAGSASALDLGSAFFHPIVFRSTTSMVPRSPSAGSYSGTVPFTWTTGDVLTITTTYKV